MGTWLAPLALAVLALFVYTLHLDRPPHFDELYHVLAARGYLATGEFRIAEGVYDRGAPFTLLVAGSFGLFGESLAAARLPSVVAGVLLVAAVFLWTRAVAGSPAAWISTLLFLFWPDGIGVAQFARFYALQGLLFWLGAIGFYWLLTAPPGRRGAAVALAAGVALCLASATSLQMITATGIAGVALWVALAAGLPWLGARRPGTRRIVLAGLAVAAVAAAAFLVASGVGVKLLAFYRWSPPELGGDRNAFWFYHQELSLHYPVLWPLFPFAALVGLASRPRPTLFCLCVFTVAFVALSFAAMKHIRYLYFVAPFLFVIFGIALAELWPHLRRLTVEAADRTLDHLGFGRMGYGAAARRGVRRGLIGAALLFLVMANAASVRVAAHLLDVTIPPMQRPPDWAAAAAALGPRLRDASVVVTTSELPALYYLGRYDLLLSKSRLSETHMLIGRGEFSIDRRTGRPAISTPESLALVMACYPDGLLITDDHRWRNPAQLGGDVADLVLARAVEIDLPGAHRMQAYRWERPAAADAPAACSSLPGFADADAADAAASVAPGRPGVE